MASRRPSPAQPYPINRTKDKLLRAIARYEYLSARQLTRLLYGNSETMVERNLSQLLADRYLQFVPYKDIRDDRPGGRPRRIYRLAQLGYDYVRSLGITPAGRFRAGDRGRQKALPLEHIQQANDLIILAHRFCKQHPTFRVERFETDAELKRHPVYFEGAGYRVGVAPDAWTLLSDGEDEYGIAWELDRATENRTVFREKVRMLVYYSQGGYAAEFETESLTIAFVATEGGGARLDSMRSWIEAELTELGAQAVASTFLLSAFNPEEVDPGETFHSPIWSQPFANQPVPLVER